FHFLEGAGLAALVKDGHVGEARLGKARGTDDGLPLEPLEGFKAFLVEQLGGKRADARMQAPCLLQAKARGVRNRLPRTENVLERGSPGTGRVACLLRLLELLRVSQQYEAPCAAGHREDVGKRHLAGLVDEQHIDAFGEVRPRPKPCRAAE